MLNSHIAGCARSNMANESKYIIIQLFMLLLTKGKLARFPFSMTNIQDKFVWYNIRRTPRQNHLSNSASILSKKRQVIFSCIFLYRSIYHWFHSNSPLLYGGGIQRRISQNLNKNKKNGLESVAWKWKYIYFLSF